MISFSLPASIFSTSAIDGVGRLLHLVGLAGLVVLADFMVLLELLEQFEPVAADVADRDPRRLGIFMRELDDFAATFLVELRDAQAQNLAFGRRRQAEIGGRNRLLDRMHHGAVPDLDVEQPRLRHADGRQLIERHVAAVGLDLDMLEQRRRCPAGA